MAEEAVEPIEETGIADAQPDSTGQEPEAAAAEGIADEQKLEAEGKPEGDAEAPQKQEPEPYELAADESFPIAEENLKSFTDTCRKAGLTKEQAEQVLGWHKSQYASYSQSMAQEEKAALEGWHKEIQSDAEFGGAHWKQTVADARKAFDAFDADGSLRQMLRDTKYQHNPVIIRAVARLGRMMQEHGWVGQGGAVRQDLPLEERMWKG